MTSTRPSTRAMAVLTLVASALVGPVVAGGAGAQAADRAAVPAATPNATPNATPDATSTDDEPRATPLQVTMTALSPSTIPRRGVLTISGSVQNRSEDEWTDITVSPFVSGEPITSRDELQEAAATDEEAVVGERLTDPGISVPIGDLAPGQSAPFAITVPRDELPMADDATGVYWIGVHALGINEDGTDAVADGRARTFIPLVPAEVSEGRSVPLSVVLPLRERARRASDGSLNGPERWDKLTTPEGRLTRLADFAASAGSTPLTWVLDPAVLDALQDYGQGNRPLSLGSPRRSDEEDPEDEDPDSSPSPSPTADAGDDGPSEASRTRATDVLESFVALTGSDSVLSLGYADPDVASLARRRPSLLRRAEDLSARRMQAFGLTGSPVVAPPEGYFDPDLLAQVPAGSLLLLSDHGELADPPLSRLPTGQELVLTDGRATAGGPAPTLPRSPIALRQRALAEAALEVTKGAGEAMRPVVLSLPKGWNPGPDWRDADFFGGLRTPWVQLTQLPRGATTAYDGELPYPRAQLAQEIRTSNVAATRTLVQTSTVLGNLLANDNDVTDKLTGAALQASSYSAQPTLRLAADQVLALNATTRSQINQVQVAGTDFVTLSGGSGSITVTLVNGLEQPITVGLKSRTDDPGVTVELPEPVSMQANQRTTLRLQVTSEVGVHEVTLSPVTTEGEDAGTPLTFSLRTSQVGRLVWYIIIAGGVLLAVMIVRRIALRIRLNRWRVEGE